MSQSESSPLNMGISLISVEHGYKSHLLNIC